MILFVPVRRSGNRTLPWPCPPVEGDEAITSSSPAVVASTNGHGWYKTGFLLGHVEGAHKSQIYGAWPLSILMNARSRSVQLDINTQDGRQAKGWWWQHGCSCTTAGMSVRTEAAVLSLHHRMLTFCGKQTNRDQRLCECEQFVCLFVCFSSEQSVLYSVCQTHQNRKYKKSKHTYSNNWMTNSKQEDNHIC